MHFRGTLNLCRPVSSVDSYDEVHRSFVGDPSLGEGLRFLRMRGFEFSGS